MKTCPRCGGEVKPSVIRCVHCGTSVREVPEPAAVAARAPVPATATVGAGPPTPAAPAPTPPTAAATTPSPQAPSADVWATPAVRAEASARTAVDPSREGDTSAVSVRIGRVDPVLLVAGMLALGAAVLVYLSLSMPWVQARIVTIDGKPREAVVAELTFSASDSFAAQIGIGLAIVFALLGLVWFWYGLDRGAPLPWLAHVVVVLATVIAGAIVIGLAQLGSFFWDDAFATHAREAGMTKEAMQQLLARHPAPLIQVQRLSGVNRFGMAVGLAIVAGVVAWWGQRSR